MSSVELKACPFCGGRAELRTVGGWSGIGCRTDKCPAYLHALMFRTPEEARAVWSRRAPLGVPSWSTPGPHGFTPPPPAPPRPGPDGATMLRGQLGVAVALLRDCLGPLEVSAALIESDDSEQMKALIQRVQAFVAAAARGVAPVEAPRKGGNDGTR